MAIYAIGDVHGQYDALMRLLERLDYDEQRDELWFVGDIINRGPQSLEALRFVVGLGTRAKVVIGNHDFTLMVQGCGLDNGRIKKTSREILAAADGGALVEAMFSWPLMWERAQDGVVMAHAGVFPGWDLAQARALNAQYVEQMAQEATRREFLRAVYRNGRGVWREDLPAAEAACFAVNAFARMRYLHADGRLDFSGKMPPQDAPADLLPWYRLHEKRQDFAVIFGHWAALGLTVRPKWACIDGGAAWSGELLAFDVDRWCVAAREKI